MIRRVKETGKIYEVYRTYNNVAVAQSELNEPYVRFNKDVFFDFSEEVTNENVRTGEWCEFVKGYYDTKDYHEIGEKIFVHEIDNKRGAWEVPNYSINGFPIEYLKPCLSPITNAIENDVSELLFEEELDNWTCIFSLIAAQTKEIKELKTIIIKLGGK